MQANQDTPSAPGWRVTRNKTLLFLPPAPVTDSDSGWRGVFTKLEYLILNHRFRSTAHLVADPGGPMDPPFCAAGQRTRQGMKSAMAAGVADKLWWSRATLARRPRDAVGTSTPRVITDVGLD